MIRVVSIACCQTLLNFHVKHTAATTCNDAGGELSTLIKAGKPGIVVMIVVIVDAEESPTPPADRQIAAKFPRVHSTKRSSSADPSGLPNGKYPNKSTAL